MTPAALHRIPRLGAARGHSEVDATDEEAYRAAVGWLETVRAKNATKLDDLTRWYAGAAIALGLEVALWIVALAA